MTSQRHVAHPYPVENPILEVQGLTKRYSGVTVVDDLTLTVRAGEIYGILGTNGAGKTTSVECAQGLRLPDSGSVRVLGRDPVADRSELAGRVGSQLQESHLPDRLRVGEAIRLFAADRTEAERSLDEWDLRSLAKSPFATLSGGQRQRLFLALALLNRPEIVFLDELTQGLDPDARRSVWELIERVNSSGTTVVLVTHFMEEAEALCDRVAVMHQGRLTTEGSPEDLIDAHGPGVRVRFTGDRSDMAWLRLLPDVTDVQVIGSEIEATGTSTLTARIGHELIEMGRTSTALRVRQPDLEDALISLLNPQEDAA